jgi:lambda family phage portal protein
MNFLDRGIAYIAPTIGLRREAARRALTQIRHFDGATIGRRAAGWRATGASANATTLGALPKLRARSRDTIRNTWWGPRIKSVVVASAVGTGIVPSFSTGNKSLNRKAKDEFKKWSRTCDAEGQLNFDALIALAVGCMVESGETLARLKPVSPTGRNRVGLELQLLEPDHLDPHRDRAEKGLVVDQGIEYGADGKRKAFWILPSHPGDRNALRGQSIRIPAEQVMHLYRKERIGQGRGIPWLAPVLLKGRDISDLEEAVVVKARIEACLAAFIKTTDTSRTISERVSSDTDANGKGRRIETMSPGMVGYLNPGEDVVTVSPSGSMAFESVLMCNWLALAAGAGITYDQMTGDMRRANFSSTRAGKMEFNRLIEQLQWLTIVPMLLDPILDAFLESAQDSGVLPRRVGGYPREWIMPAIPAIEPLKDMQTDILAVRAGRMTWPQFCFAWGLDPDKQLDEIESWMKELDRRNILLESDPRRAAPSVKGAQKDDQTAPARSDDAEE